MKRTTVIASLEASLLDAATIFGESGSSERAAAMERCLSAGLGDLSRVRPLVRGDSLTLQAGVADYAAPADARSFHRSQAIERNAGRSPWDPCFVHSVPIPGLMRVGTVATWRFTPVPDATTIAKLGTATYDYSYLAQHQLTEVDAEATITEETLPLLLIRCQAEAMKDLAMRNAHKPIQMRDSLYAQTRNGTPAALAELLMKLFDHTARGASEMYGFY